MKLVIQIPCFDEAETLPATLAALPRAVPGFDEVDVLVVDDGSTDGTADVARAHGVRHVVRFPGHRGLARGFAAGLDAAVRLGADVIVNTDADNQYCAEDIPALVRPILEGRAEMVVGDRRVGTVGHFSKGKRVLQRFGSLVVRLASDTDIPDTTSGFRAISREAALRLFVVNDFTYTLETIIQAGQRNWAITHVPIRTNPQARRSRLFRSVPEYIRRSTATILRIYTMYRPLRAFFVAAALLFLAGAGLGTRFLYYYVQDPSRSGHVQSLILAAVLLLGSFQLLLAGVVADLIAANRKMLEETLYRVRRLEAEWGRAADGGEATTTTTTSATTSTSTPRGAGGTGET
jgi:glycosyltransferase involved in cell wall biosynthesis